MPQYESDKINSGPFETHVKLRNPENAGPHFGLAWRIVARGPVVFSALLLGKVGMEEGMVRMFSHLYSIHTFKP